MPDDRKAYLEIENDDDLHCMFNPEELSLSKSNSWSPAESSGTTAPTLTFDRGRAGTLTVDLVFDTTRTGGPVTDHTDRLQRLMRVDPDLPDADESTNTSRPPWVRLHWADLHSFTAVVERLDLRFTYFAEGGVPLRARAQLRLQQYEPEEETRRQNPTSGTPRPHRIHRVQRGETLDRIAWAHYRDPARWRLLADANDVLDPFHVPVGTVIVVPEPAAASRA